MFRSAATKLAHNSTIPALAGNNDLKPLQDVILAEKQVLNSLHKLSSDLVKAAEALRIWGSGEGDDLGDILGASSTLISLWAASVSQFSDHGHAMRDYLKSIRTREEKLDDLKRRRRSAGSKAEAAEKKLSKMGPEHKNLTVQTDSLNALRAEIRAMDSDIMTEEAALGDYKRSTTRAWMGLKFGAMLECCEKGTIAGEYGKLIIGEIVEEQTQPGMPRSLYYGRNKTEQLLGEAHRCINEVVMSTVPVTPNPQRQQHQQPPLQGGIGPQSLPQLPMGTPQSTFQVPGVGQTPQQEWSQPQPRGSTDGYSYHLPPAPQGMGSGQFFDQPGSTPASPTLQQYPVHGISPSASYQPEDQGQFVPPRSVDDFGVNTSSPSLADQSGPATGGRFATFPVKNRGYTLTDSPMRPNDSSSAIQSLSSSQSPPGTVPQPSFAYELAQEPSGYTQPLPPPPPPPPGAGAGYLGPQHDGVSVHSEDEAGLAYMTGEDEQHEETASRHVRSGAGQDIDEHPEQHSGQLNGVAVHDGEEPQHVQQNMGASPSPEAQPPQYETVPPLNEPAAQTHLESPQITTVDSGSSSPRFQNQRRVPPPTVDPAEEERMLNAAAAREVGRELYSLQVDPPMIQEEPRTPSGAKSTPGYGISLSHTQEPLAAPQVSGAPSPNTDSPILPYPAYNTPPTTYNQTNQQSPYPPEPVQYQAPARSSFDSQSAPRQSQDDHPRLPPLTTPSPLSTPYTAPREYQRSSPKPTTPINTQGPPGARTISAAAFKRPQRMASGETPPQSLSDVSPLSVKKRLPSSPYPGQGREGSPIRSGSRSGSPAQRPPQAPPPSHALPPIPRDEEEYDYLSAYVDPGAPEEDQRGRSQGGYGQGRFATDLEGNLR
ncbi:hypothetical protein H0H92_003969 [Tricholoma furcatifolium]|nr:hypothetical protein H0H92_003969 [Tricholoma furcatifolium]